MFCAHLDDDAGLLSSDETEAMLNEYSMWSVLALATLDELYPALGNPGVDVQDYLVDIEYDRAVGVIEGRVFNAATGSALASLERFWLNSAFFGLHWPWWLLSAAVLAAQPAYDILLKGGKNYSLKLGQGYSAEAGQGSWRNGVRLAASRRTKTFVHASDTDVFHQVAGAVGIPVRRADTGSFSRPYVMQRNESDLDLLRRLATRNGFILFAEEGELVFGQPSLTGRSVEVRDADLRDLDWTMSTLGVPKGVEVHTWDPGARQDLEGTAGPSEVVAIGDGTLSVGAPWSLWDDIAHLSDVEVTSQALAKSVAIAELNRHSWGFLRGRAVVTGNPLIRADSRVKLLCAREHFKPDGWVVGSRHLM